jgi:hypothetical protein
MLSRIKLIVIILPPIAALACVSAGASEVFAEPEENVSIQALTTDACLENTPGEGQCKDCCDSLDAGGSTRKTCRDACVQHDFSQNTSFIDFEIVSILGPDGDYSAYTSSGDERACKDLCDESNELAGGDRRYCRDACAGGSPQGERPQPPEADSPPEQAGPAPGPAPSPGGQGAMTIAQTLSDDAQKNTIAFDALSFLTGNLGADSFFPPGKVADFWGFQYLRDNDSSQMGHNTDFLTQAAFNMLHILTPAQRAELVVLAESQVDSINQYAYMRFELMDAFRRLLEGDLPVGATGLDEDAIKTYSAELYRLDGQISFERAQVMGSILHALDADQRAYLDALDGKGMLEWPDVGEPSDIRGLDRDVKVAVMTYAGDMLSWYVGSLAADVYFCPERQGTYFGAVYMKDAPAVGNPGYNIGTNITADMGRAFLETLNPEQAVLITTLVDIQRPYLNGIVDVREQVASELRKSMSGEAPDKETVLNLMNTYGEMDGAIIYYYALNFAQVDQTLSKEQIAQLMALREELLGEMLYPSGAYLYSQPIPMPKIGNTDYLFGLGDS